MANLNTSFHVDINSFYGDVRTTERLQELVDHLHQAGKDIGEIKLEPKSVSDESIQLPRFGFGGYYNGQSLSDWLGENQIALPEPSST